MRMFHTWSDQLHGPSFPLPLTHSLVTGLQAEPRNPAPRAKRQHYGCINNIMGTDNQHKVKHRECLQSFQHVIIIYHNYKYVTAER